MKRVNLLHVLSFLTCSAHYCLNHLRTIQFTSLLFRSNNNVALPIGGLLLKHARRGTWVVGGILQQQQSNRAKIILSPVLQSRSLFFWAPLPFCDSLAEAKPQPQPPRAPNYVREREKRSRRSRRKGSRCPPIRNYVLSTDFVANTV